MNRDELRTQVAEAIRTTPATGHTHKPGEERFDHHPKPGESGHKFLYTCALCVGDVDALSDAVAAVVDAALNPTSPPSPGAADVQTPEGEAPQAPAPAAVQGGTAGAGYFCATEGCGHGRASHDLARDHKTRKACSVATGPKATPCPCTRYTAPTDEGTPA